MADTDACTIRLMEENDIPFIAKVWVYSLFFFLNFKVHTKKLYCLSNKKIERLCDLGGARLCVKCNLTKWYLASFCCGSDPPSSSCLSKVSSELNPIKSNKYLHTYNPFIPTWYYLIIPNMYYISFNNYRNNGSKVSTRADKFFQLFHMHPIS